ncbi:hypothetical protein AMTR_s00040p00066050 [Amborella trichopoda]|uniref:Uncharacterized protein n=1 Tax=Amborella trichopoda TaxID=13333 RepID=W1PXK5_AMBTC|nr:hypothetical protein AMTR_s00040p00066050 [Amborella trichopoda]
MPVVRNLDLFSIALCCSESLTTTNPIETNLPITKKPILRKIWQHPWAIGKQLVLLPLGKYNGYFITAREPMILISTAIILTSIVDSIANRIADETTRNRAQE